MSDPVVIGTLTKNARETVRVALDEFRGVQLIDIRVMAPANDPSGLPIPTQKGVALRVELLPELRALIEAAEAEARKRGLLPSNREVTE